MSILKIGEKCPAFEAKNQNGETVKSSDLIGKKTILFFYPKDNTPGCTKEAISFSKHLNEFKKNNTMIFGVSKDTLEKHEKFKKKHNLGIELVSDTGEICEIFGVWVEKSMYGKKYMGIERSTFFIDENHVIKKIWRKVKVPGHVEEVLEIIKGLTKNTKDPFTALWITHRLEELSYADGVAEMKNGNLSEWQKPLNFQYN